MVVFPQIFVDLGTWKRPRTFFAEMECEIVVDGTIMFGIHPRYQCSSQYQVSCGFFYAILLCSTGGVVGWHLGTRLDLLKCWEDFGRIE